MPAQVPAHPNVPSAQTFASLGCAHTSVGAWNTNNPNATQHNPKHNPNATPMQPQHYLDATPTQPLHNRSLNLDSSLTSPPSEHLSASSVDQDATYGAIRVPLAAADF